MPFAHGVEQGHVVGGGREHSDEVLEAGQVQLADRAGVALLDQEAPAALRAQTMPRITIGMSGWTGFAPLTLADKAGIFKKHGLNVEIKMIPQKDRHLAIASGDTTPSLDDFTDFGATPVGVGVTRSFTIRNIGHGPLNLTGNPKVIANAMDDFLNEYVWHCHILGHEENDFMRPLVLNVATELPAAATTLVFDLDTSGYSGVTLTLDLSPFLYYEDNRYTV